MSDNYVEYNPDYNPTNTVLKQPDTLYTFLKKNKYLVFSMLVLIPAIIITYIYIKKQQVKKKCDNNT